MLLVFRLYTVLAVAGTNQFLRHVAWIFYSSAISDSIKGAKTFFFCSWKMWEITKSTIQVYQKRQEMH